ncbi:MAG: aminotransferase class IV [Verrucomicrobia bacterium]|nr:aminotransferase class IV [Verrucomicrobiota bacterium]
MKVFLNGRLVPEAQAVVSVLDRGFLYGDGLFETVRVANARPFRWAGHCGRLRRGAEFLRLKLPLSNDELLAHALALIVENQMPEAILRVALSRGVGRRGYSPRGADSPTVVMSLHESEAVEPGKPFAWRLATASLRLPAGDPLAAFKTANKLPQVLARAEAEERGADEALLLNSSGEIAETTGGNFFWIAGGIVRTPPLAAGVLPGVTRAAIIELCGTDGIAVREERVPPEVLREADGMFATMSTRGVVEVTELDGQLLCRAPLTARLHAAWWDLVQRETRG